MFLLESKSILGFVAIAAGWMFRVCTGSINDVNTKDSEVDGVIDSIKNLRHIHLNEKRFARSLTNPRNNCNTWVPWVNHNHPSPSQKEDKEVISQKTLDDFCPLGIISEFECKDNNGEPFHTNQTSGDGKYLKSCYNSGIHVGVICTVLDPSLKQCPDMSIRYKCSCNAQTSTSTLSGSSPKSAGSTTATSTTSPVLKLVSTLIPGLPGTSKATKASSTTASTTSAKSLKSSKAESTLIAGPSSVDTMRTPTTTVATFTTASTTSAKSLMSLKAETTLITGPSSVETTHSTGKASVNKLTDGAEVNKQTMLQIGDLTVPWWAFVLLISGVLFVTSVCVSVCLYKKATGQIKKSHTSASVHPMDFV